MLNTRVNVEYFVSNKGYTPVQIDSIPEGFSYKKADISLRFKIALSELIIRFELGDTDFWKYRYDQILKEFLAEFTLQSSSREATMFHLVNRSLELHGGLKDKSIRTELDQLLAELKEHTSEDEIIHYYRWLNEKVYA